MKVKNTDYTLVRVPRETATLARIIKTHRRVYLEQVYTEAIKLLFEKIQNETKKAAN